MEANEHQLSIHEREVCQLQGELQQMKVQCKKVTGEAQRLTSAILGDGEAATVSTCVWGVSIYVCMYVCMYVCISTCVWGVSIYVYVCMYVHV